MFGADLTQIAFIVTVVLAVGGIVSAVILPLLANNPAQDRLKAISSDGPKRTSGLTGFRARFAEDTKDTRRKQIQESLSQVADREKQRKRRVTLAMSLRQAGLDITVRNFWMFSAGFGLFAGVLAKGFGAPLYLAGALAFVGALGLPRWVVSFLKKRRQNIFMNDFADAIDVMVRGLKSGLPVSEAMKIIATESGPPVGPEFLEVVEGQRVGITIDQGIERMVERIPLPEVNFLAIVMTIQSKTGGNLSEALGNLSRVLRDRKRMKQKVRAVSQEAKSSAAIIGSLPFIIMGALTMLNPNYLKPLIDTHTGNIIIVCSITWMSIGVLVMRKMINFQI
jgi:tight adherence protein B